MNLSLKSLIMKDVVIYYAINLFFYIFEIALFILIYSNWPYDIFWLNAGIRGFLSIFFSIVIRKIIFKNVKNFYIKFFLIVVLNPLASSAMLIIFIGLFNQIEIWILKIMGDLIISFVSFLILKK